MKTKGTAITLLMTAAVLCGFTIILIMNMASFAGLVPSKYLAPNDVRGMAVKHGNLLYTLNFDQQNALVEIFNRSIPVGKSLVDARKVVPEGAPDIERILIYRFNAPDIEAIPVGYVSKASSLAAASHEDQTNMVFSIPEWNNNGLMEEAATDEAEKILRTTYPHNTEKD